MHLCLLEQSADPKTFTQLKKKIQNQKQSSLEDIKN